jgi:anti-sigma factor RsiW
MPMSEKNEADGPSNCGSQLSYLLRDERLAGMLSAYLDGALTGAELEEFKLLLNADGSLEREIENMRRVEEELKLLGAEILDEPIPPALLDAVRRGFKG